MRGDGTGPEGRGPMTGRGLGNCLREDDRFYNGAGPGRRLTRGSLSEPGFRGPARGGPARGGPARGMGRGRGRGRAGFGPGNGFGRRGGNR